MTPEEAQNLEPGTTPGPWKLLYRDTHPNAVPANVVIGEDEEALATYDDGYGGDPEWANPGGDLPLIAAAPDMRATIAAQTWEYGVEVRADEDSEWLRIGPWWPTVEKARAYRGHAILRLGTPYSHDRVIRRPVGPVEVVEE